MSLISALFCFSRSKEDVMSWEAFQVASSSLEERVQGLVDRLDDLKRDRTKALSLCDALQLRVMKLENQAKKYDELKSHTHSCSDITGALHLRIKQARSELVRPSRKERIVEDITAVGETIFVSALFALAMSAVESVMGVFRSTDQLPTETEVAEDMAETFDDVEPSSEGGVMLLCASQSVEDQIVIQKRLVQRALGSYLRAKKAHKEAVQITREVIGKAARGIRITIFPKLGIGVSLGEIKDVASAKGYESRCASRMNRAGSAYAIAKVKLSALERSIGRRPSNIKAFV